MRLRHRSFQYRWKPMAQLLLAKNVQWLWPPLRTHNPRHVAASDILVCLVAPSLWLLTLSNQAVAADAGMNRDENSQEMIMRQLYPRLHISRQSLEVSVLWPLPLMSKLSLAVRTLIENSSAEESIFYSYIWNGRNEVLNWLFVNCSGLMKRSRKDKFCPFF